MIFNEMKLSLTREEAKAVHEIIDQLSGGNPQNVFAWDGTDNLENPTTRAMAKIYLMAGEKIPAFSILINYEGESFLAHYEDKSAENLENEQS